MIKTLAQPATLRAPCNGPPPDASRHTGIDGQTAAPKVASSHKTTSAVAALALAYAACRLDGLIDRRLQCLTAKTKTRLGHVLPFVFEESFEICRRFDKEGIEFAFPTRTLYLKKE